MQSKLEVLTTRVNEVEGRVSDIEDKLMTRKEAEEKRERQLKDHKERLREINDSLRKKKIYISLGFQRAPKGTEDQKVYLNKS